MAATPVTTRRPRTSDAEGQSEAYDVGNNRLYLSDASNYRVLIFNFVRLAGNPPSGTIGVPYSQQIPTANSQGTPAYALTSGALPPGLSLNQSSGVVSGTPTALGTYVFTVRVTDTLGSTGSFDDARQVSIAIAAVPVPATGSGGGVTVGIALLLTGLLLTGASLSRRSSR